MGVGVLYTAKKIQFANTLVFLKVIFNLNICEQFNIHSLNKKNKFSHNYSSELMTVQYKYITTGLKNISFLVIKNMFLYN